MAVAKRREQQPQLCLGTGVPAAGGTWGQMGPPAVVGWRHHRASTAADMQGLLLVLLLQVIEKITIKLIFSLQDSWQWMLL